MYTKMTKERVEWHLRDHCITAPVTIPKLRQVFKGDEEAFAEAVILFNDGVFANYHMIPGNGSLEF